MGIGGATWDMDDENMDQPTNGKSCWADWQPIQSCKDEYQPWDNLENDDNERGMSPRGQSKRSTRGTTFSRHDSEDSNGTNSTITGPPTPNNNIYPKAGSKGKIFVGGLPSTSTKEDLREYFCRFGSIVDCVVMFDRDQRHRGFGFVTFSSPDEKDAVMAMYDKHFINRKWVEVKQCIPKDNMDLLNAPFKNGTKMETGSSKPHRRSKGTDSSTSRLAERLHNGSNFLKDPGQHDHSLSPMHHGKSPQYMNHRTPVGGTSPHGHGSMSNMGMLHAMHPLDNHNLGAANYGHNHMYRHGQNYGQHQQRMENDNVYPEMMKDKGSNKNTTAGLMNRMNNSSSGGYDPQQMQNMMVTCDPSNDYGGANVMPQDSQADNTHHRDMLNKMNYGLYGQGYQTVHYAVPSPPMDLSSTHSPTSTCSPMSPTLDSPSNMSSMRGCGGMSSGGMTSPYNQMSPMACHPAMDFGYLEQQNNLQGTYQNISLAGPFGDSPRDTEENNWQRQQ